MEKEVQERNSGWDTRLETLDRLSSEIESKDRVIDEIQRTYQVFSQQYSAPQLTLTHSTSHPAHAEPAFTTEA